MTDSKQTLKAMPSTERPYDKCREKGPEVLSNAELLAVIMRTGCRGRTAMDIAIELLGIDASGHALAALTQKTVKELTETEGVGWIKAVQLQCIGEISKRIASENTKKDVRLSSPSSVAAYCMEKMRYLETEEIRAMFFDTKSHIIKEVMLSKGTVNASIITPRELFIEALRYGAVFTILLHNHPSGDPEPSDEDLLLTERVKLSGELIGIPLLDHIIIGDGRYISLKEQGLF